jgi:hypothetical protein
MIAPTPALKSITEVCPKVSFHCVRDDQAAVYIPCSLGRAIQIEEPA